MKTIGFPISHKENEKRRAIVPEDIRKIKYPGYMYIEKGFGEVLGISDSEYEEVGCKIASHDDVLRQDVICDPKIGDADYLANLHHQTVFGWIHATQNRLITDILIKGQLTAYAWEKMYDAGRHVFWFNNELAGEAAIINGFECYGRLPYGLDVAVIGNGNTARGASKVLNLLGAHVMQYNRRQEQLLRKEIGKYDAVVNCVLWDVTRKDHIITYDDLKRMRKNALIIDVSCDRHGAIQSSEPTTIAEPVYFIEGIMHYAVDHTPSIFHKTFSYQNSEIISPYIEMLMSDTPDKALSDSVIVRDGEILDREIIEYQNR